MFICCGDICTCLCVSGLQLVDMNVDFSHAIKDMYHFDMPTISSLNNISILQWK